MFLSKRLIGFTLLLCCLIRAGSLKADTLQLNLSSASDLSALTVGQTFQVDVSLSGLPAGESLDFFAANVFFNSTYLTGATPPGSGAAIPDPGAFAGVTIGGDEVSATYDDFLNLTPITANGVLFSFQLTAAAAGSGVIQFDPDPAGVGGFGSLGVDGVVGGPALPFTVGGVATAAPLPSTAMTGLGLIAALGGWQFANARRRTS